MDASSSSFQINPGSMLPHHPRSPSSSPTRSHLQLGGHGGAPRSRTTTLTGGTVRTPRTSLVSGAAPLASTTKAVKANGGVNWDDDDADDKEGDSEKKVMPRKEEVWRDILETAYGRDKAFVRCIPFLSACAPVEPNMNAYIETTPVFAQGVPLIPSSLCFVLPSATRRSSHKPRPVSGERPLPNQVTPHFSSY